MEPEGKILKAGEKALLFYTQKVYIEENKASNLLNDLMKDFNKLNPKPEGTEKEDALAANEQNSIAPLADSIYGFESLIRVVFTFISRGR